MLSVSKSKIDTISTEQARWYKKLKDAGFKDIEVQWPDGKPPNFRKIIRNESNITHGKTFKSEHWTVALQLYAHHFQGVTDHERDVLTRLANGATYNEIAKELNSTFAKVRYILTKAMRQIKEDVMKYPQPDYLSTEEEES